MVFDWDEGNRDKNLRHGVHDWEIQEALTDRRSLIKSRTWVRGEPRTIMLGRSSTSGKYLRIVVTDRIIGGQRALRPISAVEMSDTERSLYQRIWVRR
jgi:uncharacterized DUF497 family protein